MQKHIIILDFYNINLKITNLQYISLKRAFYFTLKYRIIEVLKIVQFFLSDAITDKINNKKVNN